MAAGQYDLCPKCGAVARDGECQSCGYKIPGVCVTRPQVSYSINNNNPAMSEWREQRDNWQTQNDNNHQDHCDENKEDNSYFLNGNEVHIDNSHSEYAQNDFNPSYNNSSNGGMLINGKPLNGRPIPDTQAETAKKVAATKVIVIACIMIVLGGVFAMLAASEASVNKVYDDYSSDYSESARDYEDYSGTDNSNGGYNFEYNDPEVVELPSYSGSYYDYLTAHKNNLMSDYVQELGADKYDYEINDSYIFDDYIAKGLGYKVKSHYWSYDNSLSQYDEGDVTYSHALDIDAECIQVYGVPNETEINEALYDASAEIGKGFDLYSYYVNAEISLYGEVDAYVTYTDANVMSVAYQFTLGVFNGETTQFFGAGIKFINVDVKNGRILKAREELNIGASFADRFIKRCEEQNMVDFTQLSQSQVGQMFDNGEYEWMYTPLGIEIGVNYDNYTGWQTGTFVEYEDLLNRY